MRGRSIATWATVALSLATILLVVVGVLPPPGGSPPGAAVIIFVVAASYGVVGAVLVTRRPQNVVGWLLFGSTPLMVLSVVGGGYARLSVDRYDGGLPGTALVAWLSGLTLWPVLLGTALALPLVFPDGILPSRRWRPAGYVVVGAMVMTLLGTGGGALFQPGPLYDYPTIENPLGWPTFQPVADVLGVLGLPLVLLGLVVGIAAAILRFRRGTPIERKQLTWFASAMAVVGLLFAVVLIGPLVTGLLGAPLNFDAVRFWVVASLALLPIAVGFAVLRFRLYEIDTIINRAVVYGSLTAVLAGLMAAAAAVSKQLFESILGPGSDVSLVISTVVVVSAFEPLKHRISGFVDRRLKPADPAGARLDAFVVSLPAFPGAIDPERTMREVLRLSAQADGVASGTIRWGPIRDETLGRQLTTGAATSDATATIVATGATADWWVTVELVGRMRSEAIDEALQRVLPSVLAELPPTA